MKETGRELGEREEIKKGGQKDRRQLKYHKSPGRCFQKTRLLSFGDVWGRQRDISLPPLATIRTGLEDPFVLPVPYYVCMKQEVSPLNCPFKLPCLQILEGGFGWKAGETQW